jgi:FkbM family methyltransferase
VTRPEEQVAMRRRAAAMAQGFSADGVMDWLWASLQEGQPKDLRFERLLPLDPNEFAYFVEAPVPSSVWRDFRSLHRSLKRLKDRGFEPDFVVDIGASTGVWSHAVNELFPGARFLLVEPLWFRYDATARQHYTSAHSNFEVLEVAVADQPGRAFLTVSDNLYESSLLGLSHRQQRESVEVDVTTLDRLLRQRSVAGRGLVKIDVQHAEHLVIEGGRRALSERVDVVVLEVTVTEAPEGAKGFLALMNVMDKLGFRYFEDVGEWRAPHDGTLLEKDVVLVRKELAS